MEPSDDSNSFGIEKVIDCKIEDGRQKYLVKWQPTWEDASTLQGCQNIIDEFWGFVNRMKSKERNAKQQIKKMKMEYNDVTINHLSPAEKADVRGLIARTNATSTGSSTLKSPSSKLEPVSFQNKLMCSPKTPSKVESDVSTNSLKYLQNFTNPYVKVIIVCKICNKEASKFPTNWKRHYSFHLPKEDKPHQCPHCSDGFVMADVLKRHIEKKHSNISGVNSQVKFEQCFKEEVR